MNQTAILKLLSELANKSERLDAKLQQLLEVYDENTSDVMAIGFAAKCLKEEINSLDLMVEQYEAQFHNSK